MVVGLWLVAGVAAAQDGGTSLTGLLEVAATGDGDVAASASVRLILALTTMALLPGMLLGMTPFTRFIIVFSLLRQALGLQQAPPNRCSLAWRWR